LKVCIQCGIEKPLSEFPKHRNKCKLCRNEYYKQYNQNRKPRECETKVCTKCGEVKPLSEFYKGRNQCKLCYNEYLKQYRENRKIAVEKKKCIRCREVKPLTEFWKGYNKCKTCMKENQRYLRQRKKAIEEEAIRSAAKEKEIAIRSAIKKVCTKCGEEKPLTEFWKKASQCKDCLKEANKRVMPFAEIQKKYFKV